MAHASRVHLKTSRLGVLEKGAREVGGERIGFGDDGLGVIGNEDGENALKELPGSFALLIDITVDSFGETIRVNEFS